MILTIAFMGLVICILSTAALAKTSAKKKAILSGISAVLGLSVYVLQLAVTNNMPKNGELTRKIENGFYSVLNPDTPAFRAEDGTMWYALLTQTSSKAKVIGRKIPKDAITRIEVESDTVKSILTVGGVEGYTRIITLQHAKADSIK